jgi:serine/threonine protein kinase
MLKSGRHISSELTLSRRLGGGAMGEVWLARQSTLGTDVAVKFILDHHLQNDPSAAGRFRREALSAARIHSAHVVSILDHSQTEDGTPYIVMELLEGECLDDYIAREGPLSPEQTAEVLRQVGAALDAATELGIVHRDIKPQNIFVTAEPDGSRLRVKVMDFGNAKSVTSPVEAGLSSPGMLAGSPAYLSRDLLLDPDDLDHYADLWALGVTAFKCLTGDLPFRGDWLPDTIDAILEGRLRRPTKLRPELSGSCDLWFGRVFSFDRADRPACGDEMAQSFAEAVGVDAAPSPALSTPNPSRAAQSRQSSRAKPASASNSGPSQASWRSMGMAAIVAMVLAAGIVACTQLSPLASPGMADIGVRSAPLAVD